jgi:hypothetical protein
MRRVQDNAILAWFYLRNVHLSQQQEPGPVCRYLYFLSANKKALAKFVNCVDWKVEVKAQQRMHVDC